MPHQEKPIETIKRDIEQLNRMIVAIKTDIEEIKKMIKQDVDYKMEARKGWFY
tara:strand:- start:506 stop:664 length:159 start_codon:yes stop_codon:yes gene_type:complete